MTFENLVEYLINGNSREVDSVYLFLDKEMRPKIQNNLRTAYACREEHDFYDCFDDAFLILKDKMIDNKFRGENNQDVSSFLTNTARNKWTAHKNNPKRIKEVSLDGLPHIAIMTPNELLTAVEQNDLVDSVKQIVNRFCDTCRRILSYLPFFDPGNEKKISHQEIAEEEHLANSLASRHAREECKNRLRRTVLEELNQNQKLKDILDKLFDL